MDKTLNIVVPFAGRGTAFIEAGYTFPKPLIDINGKSMIEVVANNLKPKCGHKFIFIGQKEHYDKYDLYHILQNASDNKFEIVTLSGYTQGAACTVLSAIKYINDDSELVIANGDQFVEGGLDKFIAEARKGDKDGLIMTFESSHPKWSYVRTDQNGRVMETAEKKLISNMATAGIYYFKRGADFVKAAQSMIDKDIRYNDEFYVCPVYNEMIIEDREIYTYNIEEGKMHGLGTPEDLNAFLALVREKKINL